RMPSAAAYFGAGASFAFKGFGVVIRDAECALLDPGGSNNADDNDMADGGGVIYGACRCHHVEQ
ncbi:MAG: hypothetical protein NTY46_11830, partial [Candidatus Sumerlaeota bacterium]|nr:hypothetical protein [Candidatus Sumerlaeota bacterium]